MLHTGHYEIDQLLVRVVFLLFLVLGGAGVAVGVGLIVSSAKTFRFLRIMNRWVSLRKELEPLEVPRYIDPFVGRHNRWFGLFFVAGAAFSLFVLIAKVNAAALASAFGRNGTPVISAWIVESLRWFLVAGGVLALVVGIMLVFFPVAMSALEARANRWYSHRKLGKGADDMHMTLDEWVGRSPRAAGWIIAVGATVVVINSAIVLLRHY